jgi:hypothetical protein
MTTHSEFSNEDIGHALAAAKAHNETFGITALDATTDISAGGEFSILAQCISVTVANHRVCLKLPLGIGNVCLPLPINIGNGKVAKACLNICTRFGIPTGVKVTVSVGGTTIVSKKFGLC